MAGPDRTPPGKKTVQPPRPPNAWILYRAEKSKDIGRKAQSDVSKEISAMWKAESPHIRAEYERRADLKKAEHQAMYPEYRFQPVKKEEKERLREVKKQEKERRKEAQRRGRAHPQPSPALSLPPRHYAPNPALDPLAPYYLAERRYGPSGPTPPLSAANSPSESGTCDIPQSRVEESSVSPPANASPYPQTPSSVYGSPALPPSSYGASFPDSQSPEPEPSQSIDGSEPLHWKDPQQLSLSTGDDWFNGQEQLRTQEFLSFDLPNPQINSWTGHNSSDYADIQAILSATGDPSIFQLSNFDPQTLLDHPTGQLEVSLGQMAFPGFDDPIPNLSDFPYYDPQPYPINTGANEFEGDFTLFPSIEAHPAPSHEFSGNYNADDFLNFDENASDATSTRPAPVGQRTSETSRPYAPPAGAALSSTRRVAGSWSRPPVFATNSPIEQSPTRSTWGVHA
ncbi:hypothetical protein B0H17DRAFT_1140526 [Mycena rosella]|uniref:HMG box domain-containing protein n=1 Tax=Mycena rosella TaxID=1033263 RepID=A0AAD7G7M4_MYCRO|nr:hypothetical protein B0H17DRAFT_1140526 [Mycena rosella]